MTKKIQELFDTAHQQGALSRASMNALTVVDLGAQIQAGLGGGVDDVETSEAVLVTMMPDDSGSIRFAGNSDAVREGHNLVLDALGRSSQADEVLAHTRYLNGRVLFPYTPLDRTVRMTAQNYDACHGTPLYDETVVVLGTVLAKSQELANAGVPVRTVTLLITDGCDMHSQRSKPQDVRALVEDLLRLENHIVAAMGIDDGSSDFRRVFREMGVRESWILTPKSSPSDVRKAFQTFSQSAVRASQAASFSKTALGGFVN